MPRLECINAVAVRYAVDGWVLAAIAWVDRAVPKAVALYIRGDTLSTVTFMWVGQYDEERGIWERLADLPEAVSRITPPALPGAVPVVGAGRCAEARALPMAVESLHNSGIRPEDVAALTTPSRQLFFPSPWTGSCRHRPGEGSGNRKLRLLSNLLSGPGPIPAPCTGPEISPLNTGALWPIPLPWLGRMTEE